MNKSLLIFASFVLLNSAVARANQPILSVQLVASPSVPGASLDSLTVRLEFGEIDGFAVISEPSHVLLGVVLNSEKPLTAIEGENADWFLGDVAPFFGHSSLGTSARPEALADPSVLPKHAPARVSAPLRHGTTVVFQHPRRDPNDDRMTFSMVGDLLESWGGSRIVRATLVARQTTGALEQSFTLVTTARDALSPLGPGEPYLCGCGADQPPPCGSGGGGCGCCQQCVEKREGPYCACGLETTAECGSCGKAICYCSGFPPVC